MTGRSGSRLRANARNRDSKRRIEVVREEATVASSTACTRRPGTSLWVIAWGGRDRTSNGTTIRSRLINVGNRNLFMIHVSLSINITN